MATTKKTAKKAPVQEDEAADPKSASARLVGMETAALNSAPHPEMWPFPDTKDGGDDATLVIRPEAPSLNFEYTINASGLPASSGVVFQIDGDFAGVPTFLTNKTDPQGDCSIVWRSQMAGPHTVTVLRKNNLKLGDAIVSLDYDIVHPAGDTRLGEARGTT